MNTIENNKLIAEFMGFSKGHLNKSETRWKDDWFTQANKIWGNRITLIHFHSDWNWLMEVVEKIESLGYKVNIFGNTDLNKTCDHYTSIYIPNQKVFGVRKLSKIESTYNACVEFIKWYNQQNK